MREIAIPQAPGDWWAGAGHIACPCGEGHIYYAAAPYVPGWRRCETCGGLWVVHGHGPARRLVAVLPATVRDAAGKASDGQPTKRKRPGPTRRKKRKG